MLQEAVSDCFAVLQILFDLTPFAGCHRKSGPRSRKLTTMTTKKNLSFVGIGAASVAVLTMGIQGVASAQDNDPVLVDPATDVEVEEAPAETRREKRITRRSDRQADRQERIEAMVADLIDQGVITEDQVSDAQAVREALQAERQAARTEKVEALADAAGVTLEELEAARDSGTTLAEIAGDNLGAVVDLFVERATERINAAVESGRITQEEADERLDGLEDRVTTRLEEGGGFGRRAKAERTGDSKGSADTQETAEEAVFSA